MAVDFQVVYPQESVHLNSVTVVPGPPRAVDVVGTDFRSVDEVLINQAAAETVAVLNKNRLLATIPDILGDSRVLSVKVLSRKLTLSSRSLIRFRISRTPGKVTGMLRLIQKFLKILFTTPGTDIFDKQLGGAALRTVGQTFGVAEGPEILNNLIIAVDSTARQLVALQARDPSIPLEERLLSAKIIRAEYNRAETAIDVAVEITSQTGKVGVANVEL
jgi:hypothetical protein